MNYDFETYSIPENFDDFQEDPPPQKPSSFCPLSSTAGPPRSQITNRAPTLAAFQPVFAGNRGGALSHTTPNTQRFHAVTKPVSRGCGAKDDSAEFRGQYRHTKEMYKVFTQVHVWDQCHLHSVY